MPSSSSSPTDKGSASASSPFDVFLKKDDDCDRPACKDTISSLSSALNRLKKKQQQEAQKSDGTVSVGSSSSRNKSDSKVECPPSKDYIGKSSWTLLHSMAAWYPDKPSLDEEQKMTQLMEALALFYPCTYCATDFQMNLKMSPARTKSRKDLCTWLCEQHNIVNQKLGKPMFDCSMKNLDERWRKSNNPACSKDKK